jgi:hypothetical protein
VPNDRDSRALLVACPEHDIAGLVTVMAAYGVALVPTGGVGDLGRSAGVQTLYLVEVASDGPRPAATWRASLLMSTPFAGLDPATLLPPTWNTRYPDAYRNARRPAAEHVGDEPGDKWDDEEDSDHDRKQQVFIPISSLEPLPQSEWVFTNELVPKQRREGRRFAPRAPALVHLVD